METEARIWANCRTIKHVYGISRTRLLNWVDKGFIRSTKVDPGVSTGRLFSVPDIEAKLQELIEDES